MKIERCGIKRQAGYLYYIDKNGNIARVKMARGGAKGQKSKPEVVKVLNLKRVPEHLFYIDKDGDVSSVKMARGGKKGAKRKHKKAKAKKLNIVPFEE